MKPTFACPLQSQLLSGVHEVGDMPFPGSRRQNLEWQWSSSEKSIFKKRPQRQCRWPPWSAQTGLRVSHPGSLKSSCLAMSGRPTPDSRQERLRESDDTHPLWDHGLNGEAVARLHHTHSLVLCIVRHVRCAVEQPVKCTIVNGSSMHYGSGSGNRHFGSS